jgi:hypothetical protein
MNKVALSTLLFAGSVNAGVVSERSGTYTVTNSGPVPGPTIVAVYQEAIAFCEKQHKEVATIKLRHTDQRPWKSAELRFQCVSKSSPCGHAAPAGASTSTETGDVTRKDGTALHYEPCSDAEQKREPPPP